MVEKAETQDDLLRAHHEMEMKMENDSFVFKSENGDSDDDDWEEANEDMGGEIENGIVLVGVDVINDKNMPPVDDVCPICFDSFTLPCRSNCGHWFCASCIVQFWKFKSSIQPCKCPFCCCRIVNLKPEISRPPEDGVAVEVLKKVQQYNDLYVNGAIGVFHRLLALPLFMRQTFGVLIDPDVLRCIYYGMRIIGLILALLYEKLELEFIPIGGLGIQRTFDMGASVLILTLFIIGLGYRVVLRVRVRRLVAMQAWDS